MDHRSHSDNFVGAGVGDVTHDGRINSYPACDRHRRGPGTYNPGPPATLTTCTITAPIPYAMRYPIGKQDSIYLILIA